MMNVYPTNVFAWPLPAGELVVVVEPLLYQRHAVRPQQSFTTTHMPSLAVPKVSFKVCACATVPAQCSPDVVKYHTSPRPTSLPTHPLPGRCNVNTPRARHTFGTDLLQSPRPHSRTRCRGDDHKQSARKDSPIPNGRREGEHLAYRVGDWLHQQRRRLAVGSIVLGSMGLLSKGLGVLVAGAASLGVLGQQFMRGRVSVLAIAIVPYLLQHDVHGIMPFSNQRYSLDVVFEINHQLLLHEARQSHVYYVLRDHKKIDIEHGCEISIASKKIKFT